AAAGRDGVAERAGSDATTGQQPWHDALAAAPARMFAGARALLNAGYPRVPALVIVLAACIVLPVVALISCLVQWMPGRRRRHAAIGAAQLRTWDAEPAEDMPTAAALPLSPHEAWLTVEGKGAALLLDSRRMRIGRHRDNDVPLADAAVDRYHAVIE